jgi:hypothetical protein
LTFGLPKINPPFCFTKKVFHPTAVYVPGMFFGRVVAIFIENVLLFFAGDAASCHRDAATV